MNACKILFLIRDDMPAQKRKTLTQIQQTLISRFNTVTPRCKNTHRTEQAECQAFSPVVRIDLCASQPMYPIVPARVKYREKRVISSLRISSHWDHRTRGQTLQCPRYICTLTHSIDTIRYTLYDTGSIDYKTMIKKQYMPYILKISEFKTLVAISLSRNRQSNW